MLLWWLWYCSSKIDKEYDIWIFACLMLDSLQSKNKTEISIWNTFMRCTSLSLGGCNFWKANTLWSECICKYTLIRVYLQTYSRTKYHQLMIFGSWVGLWPCTYNESALIKFDHFFLLITDFPFCKWSDSLRHVWKLIWEGEISNN